MCRVCVCSLSSFRSCAVRPVKGFFYFFLLSYGACFRAALRGRVLVRSGVFVESLSLCCVVQCSAVQCSAVLCVRQSLWIKEKKIIYIYKYAFFF